MDTPSTDTALTSAAQVDTAAATGGNATADLAAKPADGAQPAATATPDGAAKPAADGNPADAPKDASATDKPNDEGKKDGDKPTGAPEKYEAFKAPEGFEVDAALFDEFSPVLKELNLSQEQAQKVIDFAPKLIETTQTRTVAAVLDHMGLKDHASWPAALKADKELGGEQLPERLAVAKKAIETFGSPELSAVIAKTGLGDHPEMVRAFFKVGQLLKEDGFVSGGKTTAAASVATRLYDKSNMNP